MPVTVEPAAVVTHAQMNAERAPLWSQALTIAWLYWLYDAINGLSPRRAAAAMAHARTLLHLESNLHLDIEHASNAWVAAHRVVALDLADFYDLAHLGVTFVVLVTLWWRAAPSYPRERNTLVLVNVIGFLGFIAYPVAPPRMLPTFVDVVSRTHAIGSWHSGALGAHANEFAAMPSLHVGWAMWVAWTVRASTRTTPQARVWELASFTYLLVTIVVVVVTANHFVVDVIGGAITFAVAALLGRRRWERRPA